jgi:hypothetical protein
MLWRNFLGIDRENVSDRDFVRWARPRPRYLDVLAVDVIG